MQDSVRVERDFLTHLREVNSNRLAAWEGDQKADGMFHAAELAGEVGEALNIAKKLHREAMGWRGSRASADELSDELGDVLICLDKLAGFYGIDLAEATARKFNATSDKQGFPHKLAIAEHTGLSSTPAEVGLRAALEKIEALGNDGEHSGDRHARCREIARAALNPIGAK